MSNNDQWTLEKAIKPGPTLDYSKFDQKPPIKPAKGPINYDKLKPPKENIEEEPYHILSEKWKGKVIPEDHEDRRQMVNQVNWLHQNGNIGMAAKLYQTHLSGKTEEVKKSSDDIDSTNLKKCLETLNYVLKELNTTT